MEYRFIQPVSMRVTKEQYKKDLRKPLLAMGYKEVCFTDLGKHNVLITYENGLVSNSNEKSCFICGRHFIDHYNPELFLVIAAMTDKESPIIGEWLVCIDEMAYIISGYKVGEFVKNGNPNITLNWFRKATLQELIEKFTNQKQDNMKKELTQELIKDLKNLIAPENVDKFNELMDIKKPIPKKEELITGDKVILRNGETYLLIRDCNAGEHKNQTFALLQCEMSAEFMNSDAYDNNLSAGITELDVMRIYRSGEGKIRENYFSKDLKGYSLIWER